MHGGCIGDEEALPARIIRGSRLGGLLRYLQPNPYSDGNPRSGRYTHSRFMDRDIVILDNTDLTGAARQALEEVGTVRTASVTTREELVATVRNSDALIYRSSGHRITRTVLERCPRLKVIGRIGGVVDQVDLAAAADRGVAVVNAAGARAGAVADHAMALILCLARNVIASHTALVSGDRPPPQSLTGSELDGKNLGIIGFGATGRRLAQRAFAFGMSVYAHDPAIPPDTMEESGALSRSLNGLLADSDFVSLHAPLNDETRHLIGPDELAAMHPGAYLINTASEEIVEQHALVAALRDGVIAGAGLDVFDIRTLAADNPLLGLDRVVLTPRIGGRTVEAQIRAQETVAADVVRVLKGETPANPVKAPASKTAKPIRAKIGAPSVNRHSDADPVAVAAYVEWDETGLAHPSDTHPFGAVPAMRRIIETEGPLTVDRAFRLYVRGSGSTRVTKLARSKLEITLNRLLTQKQVEIDELRATPDDQAQRVLRAPGSAAIVVREIGNRNLYEVPLNEVAALMGRRLRKFPGASHDQLMRFVLNTYGWRRLTDKARQYLTAAIHLMYKGS